MKRDNEGSLSRYNTMRDFDVTDEPSGRIARTKSGRSFVIQKHDATRLHYDFRLELDGVLLSWAVPKGPSLDPHDKRLAVETEDHPIDYRDFEGTIPKGQYGGGPVIVWDRGTWEPIGDPRAGMKKGHLDFVLHGEKVAGRYVLVRTRGDAKKPSWLLIKRTDEHAVPKRDITAERPESVLTGRTIADLVKGRAASKLPAFGSIAPELATLVSDVPKDGDWIYEIKYDGYRTLAWLEDGAVKLASRRGLDWTSKYPHVADALSRVRAKSAVFDGEIAYVLEDGRTSFQELQNALASGDAAEQGRLVYFVFDLLFYDGADLTGEPLTARKDKLRTVLAGEAPPLKMSDDVSDGEAFFREACKLDLEGIIGKRAGAPYRSGRVKDWIKVKCQKRQELVIVGFTPPKRGRTGIGALLLGVHDDARSGLRYAGKVGTGFSNETLADLAKRLSKMVVKEPPVANAPRTRAVTWVAPKLVAEVRFSEWTSDGALRHPAFEGLREDKSPKEVVLEVAKPPPKSAHAAHAPHASHAARKKAADTAKPRVDGVVISHPERVIDVSSGLTKLDLARYAGAIAEVQLPYVAKRPLMMLRCPDGAQPKKVRCFVQKHSGQGIDGVKLSSKVIAGEEALYVTKANQLVLLAQNNTMELHGWGATFPRWDRPDWIVLDLDPDEALPFATVVLAAYELRAALKTLSLESWVKTTGGKGLHVVVPLARRYDWGTVKRVSQRIAELMAQAAPSRYVATMAKKHRVGKVFIDYLRNAEGATAVLPYSARARPGLPVALPVSWKELRAIDPRAFTIATVPAIVAKRKADPWADLLTTRQTLPKELLQLEA
ncbi:MAG: DNA ligase D [Labilithrix sp.]|nr:DNA ligase D [Labilithrix sp.]MCW5813897.1 DNA ligase D [Labilithrix sp.]